MLLVLVTEETELMLLALFKSKLRSSLATAVLRPPRVLASFAAKVASARLLEELAADARGLIRGI